MQHKKKRRTGRRFRDLFSEISVTTSLSYPVSYPYHPFYRESRDRVMIGSDSHSLLSDANAIISRLPVLLRAQLLQARRLAYQ